MTAVTKTHYVCDTCQTESSTLTRWLNIGCLCWHRDGKDANGTVIVEEGRFPGHARAIVISGKDFCSLQCMMDYIRAHLEKKEREELQEEGRASPDKPWKGYTG